MNKGTASKIVITHTDKNKCYENGKETVQNFWNY